MEVVLFKTMTGEITDGIEIIGSYRLFDPRTDHSDRDTGSQGLDSDT